MKECFLSLLCQEVNWWRDTEEGLRKICSSEETDVDHSDTPPQTLLQLIHDKVHITTFFSVTTELTINIIGHKFWCINWVRGKVWVSHILLRCLPAAALTLLRWRLLYGPTCFDGSTQFLIPEFFLSEYITCIFSIVNNSTQLDSGSELQPARQLPRVAGPRWCTETPTRTGRYGRKTKG